MVLDDPGAEPRQPLVLRLTAGSRAQVAFQTGLDIEMNLDGTELPTGVLPATSMVFEEVIDGVDPDGTVHYSLTFREVKAVATAETDPELVSQTQASLDELEGLSGTGTFDLHGGAQTATFDTGALSSSLASTLNSISSQVGNLAAPFPVEPVGVGARWTTTASANISGITMNTTTHYTLRSRTGDQYELDHTTEADAPPGAASFPGLPSGTRASITRFTLQSTGRTTGDLTRHLPLTSSGSGSGDGIFTVGVGAQQSELVQHLTVELTLGPA